MLRLTAALTLAALPALGQSMQPTVMDCDGWQANARNIAEPWEQNTRTFSNGKTRLALIDTVEPVGGWGYLMILSPPYDELGFRQCKLIGNGGMGFSHLDFAALQSDYDPAQGLIFTLPAGYYVTGMDSDPVFDLRIVLNQATGRIDTWVLD